MAKIAPLVAINGFEALGLRVEFNADAFSALQDELAPDVHDLSDTPTIEIMPADGFVDFKKIDRNAWLGRITTAHYPAYSFYVPDNKSISLFIDNNEKRANRLLSSPVKAWAADVNGQDIHAVLQKAELERLDRYYRNRGSRFGSVVLGGAIGGIEAGLPVGVVLGAAAGYGIGTASLSLASRLKPSDLAIKYGRIITIEKM